MEATSSMWWLTWVLGALPIVILLVWWWNEIWYVFGSKDRAKLPPGHMGFPFLGETPKFLWYFKVLRRPDDFVNSKHRRYKNDVGLYKTHLFGSPSIIACSPDTTKYVYQNEGIFMAKWPNVEIMGENTIISKYGKAHKRLRGAITSAINQPQALRPIALLVQPRITAALESWAQKGKIVALEETKKVTFENIGNLFANIQPGPLLDTLDRLFVGLVNGIRAQPYFEQTYHYSSTNIQTVAILAMNDLDCRRKLKEIFRAELETRKQDRLQGVESRNDLMDGLTAIKDEEGNQLKDEEVLDNIVTLVVAGYESTALSSMWAIYFLAKSPKVLQKIREENQALSQEKNGGFITTEEISKLNLARRPGSWPNPALGVYLLCHVVEETLRMANISSFNFRVAAEDVEYKGYKIPKGWKVLTWIRFIHTNPEHFDDPLSFNPDRWDQPMRPGTFQAFGGGARVCPGNSLARMQLAILIHHLSVGYKWELINPDAAIAYLSHPKPVDGAEVYFSKL
ncbi:Cytochrome P450 [Dillenia turbinata]|uniref:Cytochrome P450 n=1 Tax=Dillenia turbinata TaxID=194707 RepID=A0AAN8Z768_9MAGN